MNLSRIMPPALAALKAAPLALSPRALPYPLALARFEVVKSWVDTSMPVSGWMVINARRQDYIKKGQKPCNATFSVWFDLADKLMTK
jgi:hypothetical protein